MTINDLKLGHYAIATCPTTGEKYVVWGKAGIRLEAYTDYEPTCIGDYGFMAIWGKELPELEGYIITIHPQSVAMINARFKKQGLI